MRLILLSVLTYGCGDDAKFFQATGKVKEKKVAKVQAVEPSPKPTSTSTELNTESEFYPETCGDISDDVLEEKAEKLWDYIYRTDGLNAQLHRCANHWNDPGCWDNHLEETEQARLIALSVSYFNAFKSKYANKTPAEWCEWYNRLKHQTLFMEGLCLDHCGEEKIKICNYTPEVTDHITCIGHRVI